MCEENFQELKELLTSDRVLANYDLPDQQGFMWVMAQ